MAEAKRTFDAGAFLSAHGVKLTGVDENGDYKAIAPDGEERTFDVQGMLKAAGVDPTKANIEINTPDSAFDRSPLSLMDRAKLAAGNTQGQLKYLKSKFDDVAVHPDKGMLVKTKGAWQRVDSSSMDPWELTKDVVEGAVSLVPSMVGGAVGAAKGFAVGGVPGSIIGSGVGGAAGSAGTRVVLGKLAGTYEPNTEQELKDIGLDFLLNAGGQAVALGAKPTVSMLRDAAKSITKKTGLDTLGRGSLDVLADALGRTTGAGPVATRTLFDQPDAVASAMAKAKVGSASTNDILLSLRKSQLDSVTSMVEEAPKALTRKFGELVDDLVQAADPKLDVDLGGVVKRAQQTLVNSGYGKLVAANTDEPIKRVIGMAQDGTVASPESAKKVFKLLSNKEALKKITQGQEGSALDSQTRSALNNMVSFINDLSDSGKARGGEAVKALMEMKRTVNQTARDLAGKDAPASLKSFVDDFRKALSGEIGGEFHRAGLTDKYVATSNLYERFADSVGFARRALDSENGSEVLLNKLVSGIGANQTYKDFAADMAELLGEKGKTQLKSITVNEAAKGFAPLLPKLTFGSLSAGSIGVGAAASGVVSPGAALTAATQASPRLVMKEVQYAHKALEWMRALPDSQKTQWLRNPTVIRETFKLVGDSIKGEDQDIQRLLSEAGVK